MGKKRKSKTTVYGAIEGHREKCFFARVLEIYAPQDNNISFQASEPIGGSADKIVCGALKQVHRDISFAWFDADFKEINEDTLRQLANCWRVDLDKITKCPLFQLQASFNSTRRNPVLIVSQPHSVDGLILKILGKGTSFKNPQLSGQEKQTGYLKNSLNGLIGSMSEGDFYRKVITREMLEEKRLEIDELDQLIKCIT